MLRKGGFPLIAKITRKTVFIIETWRQNHGCEYHLTAWFLLKKIWLRLYRLNCLSIPMPITFFSAKKSSWKGSVLPSVILITLLFSITTGLKNLYMIFTLKNSPFFILLSLFLIMTYFLIRDESNDFFQLYMNSIIFLASAPWISREHPIQFNYGVHTSIATHLVIMLFFAKIMAIFCTQ